MRVYWERVAESRHFYHSSISLPPRLPPCRAGFPSIVACKTESACFAASGQRSILPGQVDGKQSTHYTSCPGAVGHPHSSWTPGPTSWAMLTDVRYQRMGRGGKLLMGSETPVWGHMELALIRQSVFSLSWYGLETITHGRSGRRRARPLSPHSS